MSSSESSTTKVAESVTLDFNRLPAFYRAADTAAKMHQRRFIVSIVIEIFFTLLGALALVLEQYFNAVGPVAKVQILGSTVFPLSLTTAVALLATAVTLGIQYQVKSADKWKQCRFLAEQCASLAWRYACHATPPDLSQAGASQGSAESYYLTQLDDLFKQSVSLELPEAPHGRESQLTQAMIAVRGASLAERFKVYLNNRAINQCDWYGSRAQQFRQRRNFWRTVIVGIYVLGAILVALHATALRNTVPFGLFAPNYWPLVVAAAAAVTGYIAARHYDDLQHIYRYMAQCLRAENDVQENFSPKDGDDAKVSAWVDKIETLMDGEHKQWHALNSNVAVNGHT